MTDDDDVLVCEFALRPRGAPSLFDVAPAIRRTIREAGSLLVDFDLAAVDTIREYVAAEQLCCPTIGWKLEDATVLCLRISTTPGRLQTLEDMFASASSMA